MGCLKNNSILGAVWEQEGVCERVASMVVTFRAILTSTSIWSKSGLGKGTVLGLIMGVVTEAVAKVRKELVFFSMPYWEDVLIY